MYFNRCGNFTTIKVHLLITVYPFIYERVNRYLRKYVNYLLDFCSLVCFTVPVPKARLGEGKQKLGPERSGQRAGGFADFITLEVMQKA